MAKRKFVRVGPFKLYEYPGQSQDDNGCDVRYWSGPGRDGDRLTLVRRSHPSNRDRVRWEFSVAGPSGPQGGEVVTADVGWTGCGLDESKPATAARKSWAFVESMARLYVDSGGWAE